MNLSRLIFSLLFSLSAGTFVSFACVRPERVGRKYFLYHGLIVAGLALGSVVTLAPPEMLLVGHGFWIACAVFSFFQGTPKSYLAWPMLAAGLGLAGRGLWILGGGPALYPSTLLLGLTMAAMLLGHWYLNVPGLAIEELRRVVLFMFGALVVRMVLAAVELGPVVAGKNEMDLYRYFLNSTTGIFILMRWFWGLLGPLALAYLIWDTVRLRSTQSATGILYVAVVFVLIGETIAQYLCFFPGNG